MPHPTSAAPRAVTPDEARSIASEAFVYAYPMVENYFSMDRFALDPASRDYKGPPNRVHGVARVFGPDDTGVVTPNSDTPYAFLVMDLRAEPIVVTMPPIEAGRYYSHQLVDLYAHNFAMAGTRLDGNGGGDFLVAGPTWDGAAPPGVRRVMRSPTDLVFSQFRVQLIDASDLGNVERIQRGLAARPLSAYLGRPAPPPPPAIDYPAIDRDAIDQRFFAYANFLLGFCPVLPADRGPRDRFARIGVAPGAPWPPPGLSAEVRQAIARGQEDGQRVLDEAAAAVTSSVGLFGTPEEMAGRYVERAVGAKLGLYGLSPEEAIYPAYLVDAAGDALDSGRSTYALTFAPGQLPPVDAFWSVTMYDGVTRFLVENPLDRYLINSPMLPTLRRDEGGGLALYLQRDSPGADEEPNWLPAPDGPMYVVMRLYLPKPGVIGGDWTPPPLRRTGEAAAGT